MTDDEVKRMLERIRRNGQYEYVSQAYDSTFRRAERIQKQDEEYMAERAWIQSAFMGTYTDGTEEADRHPKSRMQYSSYPEGKYRRVARRTSSRYGDIYGWVMENISEPQPSSEIEAGDTSALDTFLGGFANAQK